MWDSCAWKTTYTIFNGLKMNNGILGIKEVADYLHIKEQTVYRLVQQRKIPALKIGGQWKIKEEHLDMMFEQILQEKLDEIQSE